MPAANVESLIASPGAVDFGVVGVGQIASTQIAVVNRGSAPITISQMSVTGSSFSLGVHSSFPLAVAAGATYQVGIKFNPTGAGNEAGQLSIASDSAATSALTISLTGTGAQTAPPSTLSAISCSNSAETGAASDACMVTLSGPAPSGGMNVNLASSSAAVTVPTAVTVPANTSSAAFTAVVNSVTAAQTVTLTVTQGSVSKSFTLQLQAAVSTLTVNAASVAFGNVTLNTIATQTIILSSTGTAAVTVSAATITGAGFSLPGMSLPLHLNPGQKATLNVEFDPTVGGAATGQLEISSDSAANSNAVIGLSGTGVTVSHEVKLGWDAPANSPVAIIGYHIYRSTGGSSTYQLLNPVVETLTSYTDSAVQSGTVYSYMVKSVDDAGAESAPSNETKVTIP